MKKILLYLLLACSISTFAQAEFPEGIQVTNVQDNTALKVNVQNATGVINWKYLADFQKEKAILSTGLLKNGLISANGDPTKFNITSGIGIISNFDDPENPTSTIVNFPAFTGITPTYLLTGTITYVAINSTPAVVMQATPFTPEQRRSLITLGAVIHSNLTTINILNNISAPTNAGTNQLHDFIEAVGALNLTGNKYTANGANLQLNKSAGLIFKLGSNFANDWKNPHELSQTAMTSLTFRYRTQNGTEGSDRINLDPSLYDLNNVLTAVPNNKFTIQTVTMFQSGLTRIQYGQSVYDDLATAKNAVFIRNFVLEPNSKENGIIRAYIIMRNTTTSLQTVADADILEAQKFGGVASGGVALTLANIVTALGYTPENVANKQNSLVTDGTGIKYPTVDAVNNSIATKQETVDYSTVALWGDSLTAGTGATSESTSYPAQFSKLTGYKYYNGGVGGETSTQIKNRLLAATDKLKYSTIIWAGNNNYSDTTTIKADIATMVSALGHDRYLIVGLINGDYPDRYIGQPGYNSIVAVNSDLSTLYGAKFVDLRSYLVSLYNPLIPQDVIDHNNDIVPSSIRTDQIHLNDSGQLSVANKILLSLSILEGVDKKSLDMRYATSLFASPPYIGAILKNRAGFSDVELSGRLDVGGLSIFSGNSTVNGNLLVNNTTVSVNPFQVGASGVNGGWIWQNAGSPTSRVLMRGYSGVTETIRFDPLSFSYFNSGNFALGTTTDNGNLLRVNGTSYFDGNMKVANTTVSATPFQVGASGANGGWIWQNAGSPTSRVIMKGYNGATETIRLDPTSFSYFNSGNVGIKTSTDSGFGLDVNGTTRLQSTVTLGTPPTTSAGTYDFLTRNTTTGVVEKITSASVAPTASPTFTGNPTAPTPTLGDNDTSVATTAFVLANSSVTSQITDATSARTLSLPDSYANILFTLNGTKTITVPTNATVAFPIGTKINLVNTTSSAELNIAGAGVTFVSPNGLSTSAITLFKLTKIATDTWLVDTNVSGFTKTSTNTITTPMNVVVSNFNSGAATVTSLTNNGNFNMSSGGSLRFNNTVVTTSSTIANDSYINLCSNTITATLPTATGVNQSRKTYILKNIGVGTVTVATTSSETIDGSLTYSLTANKYVQVYSDGVNWYVIGNN